MNDIVGYRVVVSSSAGAVLHEQVFLLKDDPDAGKKAWKHLLAKIGEFAKIGTEGRVYEMPANKTISAPEFPVESVRGLTNHGTVQQDH